MSGGCGTNQTGRRVPVWANQLIDRTSPVARRAIKPRDTKSDKLLAERVLAARVDGAAVALPVARVDAAPVRAVTALVVEAGRGAVRSTRRELLPAADPRGRLPLVVVKGTAL